MNTFSITDLWHAIYAKRKRIAIHLAFAMVLALVIGFSIPKKYTSRSIIVAEEQDDLSKGGLGTLTSLAGLNFNLSTDAIVPDLYPTVVSSNPFLVDLLYDTITTTTGLKCKVIDYILLEEKDPWWLMPLHLFKNDSVPPCIDALQMTSTQAGIVKGFGSKIKCIVSDDGTIELASTLQDPLAARQLTEHISRHLQEFIVNYHTAKAASDVDYYSEMLEKANVRYTEAATQYAEIYDANNMINRMSLKTEVDRYEEELELAKTFYTTMNQQLMTSSAKLRDRTPAFTVVVPADAPSRHSSPKKSLILLAFAFFAVGANVLDIYIRLLLKKE